MSTMNDCITHPQSVSRAPIPPNIDTAVMYTDVEGGVGLWSSSSSSSSSISGRRAGVCRVEGWVVGVVVVGS